MVPRIEMPNTHFRENNIPDNIKNRCDDYSRKYSFPSFYISHSVFETIYKRNEDGEDI